MIMSVMMMVKVKVLVMVIVIVIAMVMMMVIVKTVMMNSDCKLKSVRVGVICTLPSFNVSVLHIVCVKTWRPQTLVWLDTLGVGMKADRKCA